MKLFFQEDFINIAFRDPEDWVFDGVRQRRISTYGRRSDNSDEIVTILNEK